MVKTITVIYGCHGSGKTTLVRNILGDGYLEKKLKHGFVSFTKDKKIVALGQYHCKTGGTDCIKGMDATFMLLSEAIDEFKEAEHIIMEGIFLSSVIGKPMKLFSAIQYGKGIKIEMFLLKTSAEVSLRRVYARNGNVPNINNIVGKVKRAVAVFQKMAETGEFDCFVINTDHLTAQDVFGNFKMVSACFRR